MIDHYISELLFKFESVIIPGFGTFELKYTPSTIHPVEHKILPPTKYVSFDPSSKNNDGILANYLSEKEKVSFFDACGMILDFVEKTNKSLDKGKEVVMAKLGVLTKTIDGIVFKPDTTINYNTDAFGMNEITSAPILREEVKVKMQEHFDAKIRAVKDRRAFPRIAVWITIIVVILGGATAALFVINPAFINEIKLSNLFTTNENKSNTIKVVNQKSQPEINLKENIQAEDTVTSVTDSVQNDSADISNIPVKPTTGKFHIISASFRVKQNAENYSQTLSKQGYQPEVIFVPEKGLHVVSYNSYATEAEAKSALEKIRKSVNADAWLLNN